MILKVALFSALLHFSSIHYGESRLRSALVKSSSSVTSSLDLPFLSSSSSRQLGDVCAGNLIQNSDGISPDQSNFQYEWRGMRCDISVVDDAYLPGSKAYKASNRFDLNAGIVQTVSAERMACLKEGEAITVTFRMKLEDASGEPFACSTAAWNKPNTCPLLSFRVQKSDGTSTWFNSWNQANLHLSGGWKADQWNLYKTHFIVNADMANALSLYFTIRGPSKPINYYLSDGTITIDNHVSSAPSEAPDTPSPTVLDSAAPTIADSDAPTVEASSAPTVEGSSAPTVEGSSAPTVEGSSAPTVEGSSAPTVEGSSAPTVEGSSAPTLEGSSAPTAVVTKGDTLAPTQVLPDPPTAETTSEPDTNNTANEDVTDIITDSNAPPGSYSLYKSPEAVLCDMGLSNGDFEGTFNPAPWTTHLGGVLTQYTIPNPIDDNHKHALKLGERTSLHDGPKHPIDINCFVTDRVVEVKAKIKMTQEVTGDDGAVGEVPYGCDPQARSASTCPILTVEVIYESGSERKYSPNDAVYEWKADEFNDFHAFFQITEDMTLAKEASFYFERPPPGVNIIIDDVTIEEFQPVPIGNIHEEGDDNVYPYCDEIVTNGNAETGDTSGWTVRVGGHLSVRPEGSDQTDYSFQHSGRSSFIMGPKHALKTNCLVEGVRYAFDAKIKLLDENDEPFACDKSHTWIDDKSCPLLTFQLENEGSKSWNYYGNEAPGVWEANLWNSFHTFFTVTEKIANAENAYFYIERPRAGVSIIIDQVTISRDCTELIANGNAEHGSIGGWKVLFGAGGEMKIHPEGADGSANSFGHFGRVKSVGGPGHMIDLGCLVEGAQYEFTAKFKLLDEANNLAPVACKTNVAWGDPELCPIFAIYAIDENGNAVNTRNYVNTDPTTVNATSFNKYRAIFTVDAALAASKEASFFFKGSKPGLAFLLDDVVIKIYEPPEANCDSMVPNGDFEHQDFSPWHIRQTGSLQVYNDGAEDGSYSLLNVEREMSGAGAKLDLNTTCLVEGKRYQFRAFTKLLTEDGTPFACTKSKGYNDPLACPLLGFEFKNNGQKTVKHHTNDDPTIYETDDWNLYQTVFTITHDLATAEEAFFFIHGPAPGVGILIDRVSLTVYEPPPANCYQLVSNNDAEFENGSVQGWKVNGGGYISIREGGYGASNHSFIQTHRTAINFGPLQTLRSECLGNIGDKFIFNAELKLLDEDGNPFACSKSASWNTDLTCPLLSFQIDHPNGLKRAHFSNNYGGAWESDGWNQYRAEVTVTKEMTEALSVSFYLQGPRPGVSIIFDYVTLVAAQPPTN